MDNYKLRTVDYTFEHFAHQGLGGMQKYIATPVAGALPKLMVKHENRHSACNEFVYSRLAELCGIRVPKAYLLDYKGDFRGLFVRPYVVGIEFIENFSPAKDDLLRSSPELKSSFLGAMAMYALCTGIADNAQFGYTPDRGIWAFDLEDAFNVSDFIVLLGEGSKDLMLRQLNVILHAPDRVGTISSALMSCFQKAVKILADDSASTSWMFEQYTKPLKVFSEIEESTICDITDALEVFYPLELVVYYEEYIKRLQIIAKEFASKD